jgi:hypothetical protein
VNILHRATNDGSNGPKYGAVADSGLTPESSVPVRKCGNSASTAVITGSIRKQLEANMNKSKHLTLENYMFESNGGARTLKSTKLTKVQKQDDRVCKICETHL